MKSILLSIKPKWVAKILNGEKTIEVRKNKALYKATMKLIEEQGYATFFMYCTKDKGKLIFDWETEQYQIFYENECNCEDNLNGKVVAKFTVRKVEHFEFDTCSRDICGYWLDNGQVFNIKKTCLTSEEMSAYIGGKDGYVYHIEDLVIFDKPKRLCDFRSTKIKYDEMGKTYHPFVKNSPQNFCYVESEE